VNSQANTRFVRAECSEPLVLLVDDDDSLRRALARSIRLSGYEVEEFHSAEDLLSCAAPATGACLVLDIDMPGIDGVACKRALIAGKRDLPTIFITALGPAEAGRSLAEFHLVTVLYKPFNKETLLEAIRRVRSSEKRGD
jgi:FixJ family two-component response regulator